MEVSVCSADTPCPVHLVLVHHGQRQHLVLPHPVEAAADGRRAERRGRGRDQDDGHDVTAAALRVMHLHREPGAQHSPTFRLNVTLRTCCGMHWVAPTVRQSVKSQ